MGIAEGKIRRRHNGGGHLSIAQNPERRPGWSDDDERLLEALGGNRHRQRDYSGMDTRGFHEAYQPTTSTLGGDEDDLSNMWGT